jgi:hypothetical protein
MSFDEAARRVSCSRCKETVVESPGIVGTVMFNYYTPTTGLRHRGALCGPCGLSFREFLHPEISGDPVYQEAAARLREAW